jgi:hypothetical protein
MAHHIPEGDEVVHIVVVKFQRRQVFAHRFVIAKFTFGGKHTHQG